MPTRCWSGPALRIRAFEFRWQNVFPSKAFHTLHVHGCVQHLKLIAAVANNEKHCKTSVCEVTDTEACRIFSDSESVGLWSSLSTYINADKRNCDATDTAENMLGLSASLFNDADSFGMEEEEPASYVPAPAIAASDLDMNMKAENILYILKDVLAGPVNKFGMEGKCLAAWRLLDPKVKVQDPLVCIQGKKRLHLWMKTLAAAGTVVDLHEIYAESSRSEPFKRWVYAVWTLSLTQDLRKGLIELGIWNWWMQKYDALSREIQNQSKVNFDEESNTDFSEGAPPSGKRNAPIQLNLSGESKFELDNSGQVVSIQSAWYITKDGGREMFEIAKLWLAALLHKEANG